MMKPRIAIWLPGGIGTGDFSQGYPVLDLILGKLSETYSILLYSYAPFNEHYASSRFEIRSASKSVKGLRRWLFLASAFLKDHRKENVNLVLALWGFPAGIFVVLLGRWLRIPSTIYVLGGDAAGIASINYGIFHRPIRRWLALWAYRHANVLLTISEFQRDFLKRWGILRIIHVVPWGADPALFYFREKPMGSTLNCLHIGHLTPVKDQATLLRAFDRIRQKRPACLRIVGGDNMNGAIQKSAAELNLNNVVEFSAMMPYDKIPALYAWADVLMHTSLSEGQSMALTEAAACGVLLAGTKVGMLYDLGEKGGVTIEPGDDETLASRILEIMDRPDEWRARVTYASMWSKVHSFDNTISELTRILNSVRRR